MPTMYHIGQFHIIGDKAWSTQEIPKNSYPSLLWETKQGREMYAGSRSCLQSWGAYWDGVLLASAEIEVHEVNLFYVSETQKKILEGYEISSLRLGKTFQELSKLQTSSAKGDEGTYWEGGDAKPKAEDF